MDLDQKKQEIADKLTYEVMAKYYGERFIKIENVEDDAEMNDDWEWLNERFYALLAEYRNRRHNESFIPDALDYLRENIERGEIEREWDYIDKHRCLISYEMHNKISDLLDDFALDNDLPSDWWCEITNTDEIFAQL